MRLRKARDFKQVFRRGKRFTRGPVSVLACPNTRDCARLGLAIARKHVRNAIARNHIKRVVRESFREHLHALAGLDLVIVSRPGAGKLTGAALRSLLERNWSTVARDTWRSIGTCSRSD